MFKSKPKTNYPKRAIGILGPVIFSALIWSNFAFSGSLYSFDNSKTMTVILSHIQSRNPDLAKLGLTPLPLQPEIDRSGKLVITAMMSYPAKNELGVLYVCAEVNENGELLNMKRDILPRKGVGNFPLPDSFGC